LPALVCIISLAKLQVVGITCLFVASKVEEIVAPSVSHFLHCADSSYTESENAVAFTGHATFLVAAATIWLSRLILGNDKWVRDVCSFTLIMLIALSDSSPPILPVTRRMRKAP
jgi:hypothetical protein